MTEAPETVYLLELSLDGVKADGKFHRLKSEGASQRRGRKGA